MMKLKDRVVMILILSSMLLCTLFGALITKRSRKETVPDPDPDIDEPITVPSSFLGKIDDEYGVPKEVVQLITDYMDAYYLSVFKLEMQDMKDLFSNERMEEISEKSIGLMIDVRKLYDFDFSLTRAHYDLKISDYRQENGLYYVDLLEDDYMSYAFLNGLESQAFEIENSFVIREEDKKYKIEDLEKIQGYYMAFYDDERDPQDVYDYYYSELKDMLTYHEEVLQRKASQNAYSSDRPVSKTYDRNAAVAYLDQYSHSRNPQWYNFTDEGGNCQNYASQAMLAGGIPMDYEGEEQWKCYVEDPEYDPGINEDETALGRTRSWVNVG
ncbi:MAG: amidase domain-containing protein, partial [Erysipelotrichaceae bacterium]|nr:amidase domain-containing protein [Erysipelotrichaceae bacterium]